VVAPQACDDLPPVAVLDREPVDLATNALAGGPYPAVVATITATAHRAHAYPAASPIDLQEAIAVRHHLDTSHVIPAPGSATALQRLIAHSCSTSPSKVMFSWPNFMAIPDLVTAASAHQQRVPPGLDGCVDLTAMLAAISPRTRVVIICNPDNPTGTLLARSALRRFLESVPDHVLVILDEAYAEFADGPDAGSGLALAQQRWAAGHQGVAVTRTLSKAFGLGGLRIGYALAAPRLAAAVRARALPYEITSPAHAAALAALGVVEEVTARCRSIAVERRRVENTLRHRGFTVSRSHGNFVWLPMGDHALGFAQHVLGYGIRVLPYPGDGVRITVGTPEDNTRFLVAADAWLAAARPVAPASGGDAA
jgi:histidinol-phosphate aminotransferase